MTKIGAKGEIPFLESEYVTDKKRVKSQEPLFSPLLPVLYSLFLGERERKTSLLTGREIEAEKRWC